MLKTFLSEETALGTTEYVVILSLIAVIALVAIVLMGSPLGGRYASIEQQVAQSSFISIGGSLSTSSDTDGSMAF